MARPINIEIREKKRNDILKHRHEAYPLAKGYDHVSVQDIRDELWHIKRAFHHYFKSREALLGRVRLSGCGTNGGRHFFLS